MSTFKKIAKGAIVQVVARVAPITWRWRKPGSLVVLMYHRVLPKDSPARKTEQPGMYVSPETLDLHLTELKRRFELVHLDDWLRRAKENLPLPKLACAITFDDGWRDNNEFALPVLVKHGAPATIFLVSSYIGGMQRFWPNRLMSLMRDAFGDPDLVRFPRPLSSIIEPVIFRARSQGELRIEDMDRVVKEAKSLDETQIRNLIDATERSGSCRAEATEILAGEEIVRMAATGLIRFGSHTATHFRLNSNASNQDLDREIIDSRRQIRGLCGQRVDLFCYPNGDMSSGAVELVRRYYLGAVTTRKGWHRPVDDAYLIRRIGMHDDVSQTRDSFCARLAGWT